jgi:hypothetical protein
MSGRVDKVPRLVQASSDPDERPALKSPVKKKKKKKGDAKRVDPIVEAVL